VISATYRDGGGSGAIRSEIDALAYALARMPATYAAVTASLNARPRGRAWLCADKPARCRRRAGNRDLGRGRGIFVAAKLILLDAQCRLRALALDLGRDSPRLRDMTYQLGEARAGAGRCRAGRPCGGELHDRRD